MLYIFHTPNHFLSFITTANFVHYEKEESDNRIAITFLDGKVYITSDYDNFMGS